MVSDAQNIKFLIHILINKKENLVYHMLFALSAVKKLLQMCVIVRTSCNEIRLEGAPNGSRTNTDS